MLPCSYLCEPIVSIELHLQVRCLRHFLEVRLRTVQIILSQQDIGIDVEQGKTILISTHKLDLALALSDRILLMSPHARGVQLDTAENLKKADAFTSAFGMDIFDPLG